MSCPVLSLSLSRFHKGILINIVAFLLFRRVSIYDRSNDEHDTCFTLTAGTDEIMMKSDACFNKRKKEEIREKFRNLATSVRGFTQAFFSAFFT